ncbi:MAG TPA: TrmH family RNA methyltransferase [Candidatus Woesebacteria bacterium]|nr:TrmH family RNA methyltransferase [Candidatus Woesebacteria bacterium]
MSLNSHQLRKTQTAEAEVISQNLKRQPFVLVLDNVLDTYNIGSFFRLADAVGAAKIYLCGPCLTPPNIKIHRASIGTWKFVPWERYESTVGCVQKLKQQNYSIVASEITPKSLPYNQVKYQLPLALIIGSEINGVSTDVLELTDQIVKIPMFGINKSLNVLVAAGVILYHILAQNTA